MRARFRKRLRGKESDTAIGASHDGELSSQ
jgi:hypothetical protein